MPYYQAMGTLPAKRHMQYRQPDGSLYIEEMIGEQGFSADSCRLYHVNDPVALTAIDDVIVDTTEEQTVNHPLSPWHFRTGKLEVGTDLLTGRRLLLANEDVRICFATGASPGPLYRNAAGDELIYVQSGELRLESVVGVLRASAGDYVVIPAGITHRLVPTAGDVQALVLECRGHVRPPRRYQAASGQFLEGAPYCERDLRGPSELLNCSAERDVPVLVRHRNGLTRYVMANHPFDVVAWDGFLYPYALNIRDFEPLVGRLHQPPPIHQTFEGSNFVVCSFTPRPFDFDPLAIPVPYVHANIDSDEVLFYSSGSFMSRRGAGVEPGSMTLHPSGFTHGPQPGAVEFSLKSSGTDEVAVMVDTFRPLRLGADAIAAAEPEYHLSWVATEMKA